MGISVLTSEQMTRADQLAIEEYGIPGILLMEAAARGIAREVRRLYPGTGRVLILAGPGNNGGDGFAAARLLHHDGLDVEVLGARALSEYSGDAGINARILPRLGVPVDRFDDGEGDLIPGVRERVRGASVLVDALLGTGARPELHPSYLELVRALNSSPAPVVAVDIPTGVDADTGCTGEEAVAARVTVTFAAPKIGLLLEPGSGMVGELVIEDIGIPRDVLGQSVDGSDRITLPGNGDVRRHLPGRSPTGHKGTYGHVLVIGGAVGMTGAVVMTAAAALRSGAGLVTCAVPERSQPVVAGGAAEAMTLPLPIEDPGRALDLLAAKMPEIDVIALGPGMGRGPWVAEMVEGILCLAAREETGPSMVVDADGLNAVAGRLYLFAEGSLPGRVVLTPHPGEMARLLECGIREVIDARLEKARRAAVLAMNTVILKGAPSITASPDGSVFINTTGNPGLATGGSGDVLTGVIAALIGQGLAPRRAAWVGCFLHGLAADAASKHIDIRSMLPRDVIASIPDALASLE